MEKIDRSRFNYELIGNEEVYMMNKIDELVEEHGELIARVERVTTAYHDLRERLDNHISKERRDGKVR